MIFRRIAEILLITAILIMAGCNTEPNPRLYTTNEGPVAYGANGLSAPAVYKVKPTPPKTMGYPAFAMANVGVGTPPVLPAMQEITEKIPAADRWQGIHDPLRQGLNPDLVASRALPVAGMNPKLPMPIEQKIYGGAYGKEESDKTYRHLEGDILKIVVKNSPEFCGEVTVADDGYIQLPGTEDFVKAKGLDTNQIANNIVNTIRPYIRKSPAVRVTTLEARGGYYYIFGGVKNQGRFPIGKKPIKLSEAVFRSDSTLLAQAQSINAEGNAQARDEFNHIDRGWLGEVVLITPHRIHPIANKYNVAESIFGGLGKNNPVVKPGQIIIVPDRDDPELETYIQRILIKDNYKLMLQPPEYASKRGTSGNLIINNNNINTNNNNNHQESTSEPYGKNEWENLSLMGKVAAICGFLL